MVFVWIVIGLGIIIGAILLRKILKSPNYESFSFNTRCKRCGNITNGYRCPKCGELTSTRK